MIAATNPIPDSVAERRWISRPQVLEKTGISTSTLYELMARGDFPRAVKVGRCSRWILTEVDAWMAAREEARR